MNSAQSVLTVNMITQLHVAIYKLVGSHVDLNAEEPKLFEAEDYVHSLEKYTNGKPTELAIEGDVEQARIDGELILFFAHKYNEKIFEELRQKGRASRAEITLDYIAKHRPKTFMNIELKPSVDNNGMKLLVKLLRDRKLDNYLYDSFHGNLLKIAKEVDPDAIVSHHAIGYWSDKVRIWGPSTENTPDIYTIPYPSVIGKIPIMPMIYGMVNSPEKLEIATSYNNVYGASARFGDSNILKILMKSISH